MLLRTSLTLVFSFLLVVGAQAQLPKSNLTIELRQITDASEPATGYHAGTLASNAAGPPQAIVVRNGEKGTLKMQESVPLQWVQSAQSQGSSVKLPGAEATSSGGGVTQALHWFDVGQSMTVTPKWPGGKKEVALEIEVQQGDMQTEHNAELPRQTRNLVTTLVSVPVNTWVTLATSGKEPPPAGNYSSESNAQARTLLQVRVTYP